MKFEYKSSLELKKLPLEQLNLYYRELRKYKYENNILISLEEIALKKQLNKIIVAGLREENKNKGRKIITVNDDRIHNDIPKIYAVTHGFRYDIEVGLQVINDSNYLLMADPGESYRNIDGKLLSSKGVIYFDTFDPFAKDGDESSIKLDKKIAYKTCIRVLELGGNIFLFPEGAWNITENQLVMKLFNGAVRMARETGAQIIPIALTKNGNDYYSNIGKNITILKDDPRPDRELSDNLRGILARLKYDILINEPIINMERIRKMYGDNYYEIIHNNFVESIMSETENGYTIEEIERTRYKDKDIVTSKEAFNFSIIPNENNNFLTLDDKQFEKYTRQLCAKKMIYDIEQQKAIIEQEQKILKKVI